MTGGLRASPWRQSQPRKVETEKPRTWGVNLRGEAFVFEVPRTEEKAAHEQFRKARR